MGFKSIMNKAKDITGSAISGAKDVKDVYSLKIKLVDKLVADKKEGKTVDGGYLNTQIEEIIMLSERIVVTKSELKNSFTKSPKVVENAKVEKVEVIESAVVSNDAVSSPEISDSGETVATDGKDTQEQEKK